MSTDADLMFGGRKRHPAYWFDDGSIILLIEGCLFKIHKSMLIRLSDVFRDMFALGHRDPGDGKSDGETEDNPLHLQGDLKVDWERFLAIIYPEPEDILEETTAFDECDSVLGTASKYMFTSIRTKTILRLLGSKASYADLIVLGHRHHSTELLIQGYLRARQEIPLTLSEGKRLKSEDVILLMQLHESCRGSMSVPSVTAARWIKEHFKDISREAEVTVPEKHKEKWEKLCVIQYR
ncbi:hypothetical protein M0805_004709 [Coniferiporia weirii]|nr:hypothetical protein M0805_004709 [Coniferiporia weirii]